MQVRRLLISVGVLAFLFGLAAPAFAATITFSSANHASFVEGDGGTFTVRTTGFTAGKPPTLTATGTSSTVHFTDNGDGTGTLTVDDTAAAGTSTLTFTATPNATSADTGATQSFTLTVVAPAEQVTTISPSAATMTVGQPGQINISTSGFDPVNHPILSVTGPRPTGVTFVDNHNGTGKIIGTPAAGTAGSYNLTLHATANDLSTDPDASAPFSLTVLPASTGTNGAACVTLNSSQAIARDFKRNERFFVRGTMPAGTTKVQLRWNGGTPFIGSDGVGTGGSYLVAGVIPAKAALGANTVVARGTDNAGHVLGTASCGLRVVTGTVSAAGVNGTATLPRTGFPTSALVAIGVTMVELGAGLLLYTDRRRAQPVIGPWLQRTIERLER